MKAVSTNTKQQKYLKVFQKENNLFEVYDLMEKRDIVVTISSYMSGFFSPSFLNNNIGSKFTDKLAEIRNKIFVEELKYIIPVLQTFKEVVFISKKKKIQITELDKIKTKVLVEYVHLCEKYLKKENLNSKQKEILKVLLTKFKSSNEFLNFAVGLSKVKDCSNYKQTRYYLIESLIDARISKLYKKEENFKVKLKKVLQEIQSLSKKLCDERIVDINNQAYRLFLSNSFGDYKLNPDLMSLVRKEQINVLDKHSQILLDFKRYISLIDVFAVVTYNTVDELVNREFLRRVKQRREFIEKLKSKNSLSGSALDKMLIFLKKDFNMPSLLSKFGFECKLLENKGGVVLLLDAKNLGVRDILDCEEIAKEIAKRNLVNFEDILITRGDNITKRLREDIARKMEILGENGYVAHGYRCGDSVYIYVEEQEIPNRILKNLVFPMNTTYRLAYMELSKDSFKNHEAYETSMKILSQGEVFIRSLEQKGNYNSNFFIKAEKEGFKIMPLD